MAPRTNRIEVDLKLLQDSNVEKLQGFGRQFDKSIDKLATLLGTWNQQVEGAANMARQAGRPSPDASTPGRVSSPAEPARMGGTGGPNAPVNAQYGGGGGPSVPFESIERQIVRAQRRIGGIPIGIRQGLGYLAEGGPVTDDEGYRLDSQGRYVTDPATGERIRDRWWGVRQKAALVNENLFRAEAIGKNVALGFGHLQNTFAATQAPVVLGQSLGASRAGGVSGVGSHAFWLGVRENFDVLKTGAFGFDPAYSVSQAKQARDILHGYGYSGDTANMLSDRLKHLQVAYGVDPQSAMALLDPLMRFGGVQSFTQLNDVLGALPAAANAARMNLQQFTQQVIQTATQVAQSTGMPAGVATAALASFSAVTGLSPTIGGNLLSNPQNVWLAAGMTGQSLNKLMTGGNNMAAAMAFPMQMFQSVVGISPDQLAKLAKTNPTLYDQKMSDAWGVWLNNKDIFGGMSPMQIMQFSAKNQGRTLQHISAFQQIQDMRTIQGSHARQRMDAQIEALLHHWGGTQEGKILANYHRFLQTHPDATPGQEKEAALAAIGRQLNRSQQKSAQKITIELSGDAKKYFKLHGEDTPTRNQNGGWERKAINLGSSALNAGETLLHILGG